jgi:hypothetical protein
MAATIHASTQDRVKREPGVVANVCNASTQEAEAGGFLVQGQPGLPPAFWTVPPHSWQVFPTQFTEPHGNTLDIPRSVLYQFSRHISI